MQDVRRRMEMFRDGVGTQTAFAYVNGRETYEERDAQELAKEANRLSFEKGRTLARQKVIAGGFWIPDTDLKTGDLLTTQVVLHVQWENPKCRSYFARLPSKDGRRTESFERLRERSMSKASPPSMAHFMAVSLLVKAINAGVRIRLRMKCERRGHLIDAFVTDPTMKAKAEVSECVNGKKIRTDVVIYSEDGRPVHRIEVLHSHRTETGSRGGLSWSELLAGRVLCELEKGKDDDEEVAIPCEPREDIARSCAKCADEEKKRLEVAKADLERAQRVERAELEKAERREKELEESTTASAVLDRQRREAALRMQVECKPGCSRVVSTYEPEVSQEEVDRRRRERLARQAEARQAKPKKRRRRSIFLRL